MTTTVPRFEELAAPSHWRTVDFISDLHLQASEPATVAAWRHYLQTTPADALFILGDLFEVWVGDDALQEPGSFEAQACAALQQAAQRLPVFFMHGNRDFLAGDAFLRHCGINGLKNANYTVAMARTSDPHSATAQFFINVADNGFLNHTSPTPQGWGYAVFGKVVSGTDVVDKIKAVKTGRKGFHDDVPKEDVVIEKAVAL